MALKIKYRNGNDEVSERVISDVTVEPPNKIHALCQLRGENRTFVLSRIEQAVDLDTGKIIPDIWMHLGIPSLKPPSPTMPVFVERPQMLSTEEAQRQRKADKDALFKRFKYLVIADAYKAKLWDSSITFVFAVARHIASNWITMFPNF